MKIKINLVLIKKFFKIIWNVIKDEKIGVVCSVELRVYNIGVWKFFLKDEKNMVFFENVFESFLFFFFYRIFFDIFKEKKIYIFFLLRYYVLLS